MNSKAFTLIELIAIILILGVIALVSFPVLTNMSKNNEDESLKSMIKDLCLAGETYIRTNSENFSELSISGSTITIKIDELVTYGSVDRYLINPKTKKSVLNDVLIYTVLSDYTLKCVYDDVE